MRPLDWLAMVFALAGLVLYGLWRSRGSNTTSKYLLAGRTMPWYAMALSIMATQASAITFISTTGQAYVDGMRFVQFYFGLPLAMIIISAVAVARFHSSGVYTAYEYLERRFDARTRALVSFVFLIARGISVGVALYAPSVVMTVILGWPDRWTTLLVGSLVVAYTVSGGIAAVTWTDVLQMCIMTFGLIAALITAISLLPADVSFAQAIDVAGAASRLNPLVWRLDFNDRYNIWSGLLGGMFLMLAYFGCDQSQVQRYLTGKSVTQSKLSLLFNAVAKIPMQFFILFIGAMVFSFHTFEKPPVLFKQDDMARLEQRADFAPVQRKFDRAWEARRAAAGALPAQQEAFRRANNDLEEARNEARRMAGNANDTNYVFLSFVTRYMPAGLVGILIAMIFGAAMSTISGEINSLATVTIIDHYKRFWKKNQPDTHYLLASRWATAFWGMYAIITAQFGKNMGSLIEAVNALGSLFYGGLLGVFTLAFFFPSATGSGAFWGVIIGEAVVFAVRFNTGVAFLWLPLIGAATVVASGMAISAFKRKPEGVQANP